MPATEIDRLIDQAAENCGYMIYEKGVLLKGGNSQVKVKIDSLDGISHRDCEMFSRELSALLEESELLPNYSLEVSSPGVRRKLRNREEFERFIGSPVKVIWKEGDESGVVIGRLEGAGESTIDVKDEKKVHHINIDSITSANIEII
jgi:ribosome maturation factor RimP